MNKILYLILLITIMSAVIVSCTKQFNDINTSRTGIPYSPKGGDKISNVSSYLPTMMGTIYACNDGPGTAAWMYQIQISFNSDIYSGYWMPASGFGQGVNSESNNKLVQSWDDWLYNMWASPAMSSFNTIQSATWGNPTDTNKIVLGMAYVVKVLLTNRVADALGTIPYTNFGSATSTFDDLKTIYTTLFKELDSAVYYLSGKAVTFGETTDLFYGHTSLSDEGKVLGWKKLANSLRLRLAMRIVNVDPNMAKTEAEKAMSSKDGLINDNKDNAGWFYPNATAPLTVFYYIWGASVLPGADVESYLVGYSDPRLPVYLTPYSKTNTYVTKRLGTASLPESPQTNVFSEPGTGFPKKGNDPNAATFFNAAETYFLLAEAALRGWKTGSYPSDAKANYETGIQKSMEQWGVNIGTYLTSVATPSDYKDPTIPGANIKAISTCTPSWVDGTQDNEHHLEKIITQKWIALWPVNGSVSWAEYRRTGYPKLFPAYTSVGVAPTMKWNGGQTVNVARKLMLPFNEYTNNAANTQDAITKYLGGTDLITTHVWWDVDKGNF